MQGSVIAVLAATVLVFLTLLQSTLAIECYVCNSLKDPECDGAPNKDMLKNCSEARMGSMYSACRKIDVYVDFKVHELPPLKRVIRQCAMEAEPDRPCYYKAGFGGRVNVCHCFDPKCNSAQIHTISLGALATATVFVLFRLFSQ
ncbi:UPAR/Ly6 domain-containing protein crok-like [Ornithodoros turicata]|uniref:Putative secreted salivary protein n=1 Tax=Ornithodoros turicata TaxID=34597 RepID=A0A2R5LCI4_9ACAR